jgi:hypothetical protein
MIFTKYQMIIENGYIETLIHDEAIAHGNYQTIQEDIENLTEEDYQAAYTAALFAWQNRNA